MPDDNSDFTAHERAFLSVLITKIGGASPHAGSPNSAKKVHACGTLEVERIGRDLRISATNRVYATPEGQKKRPDVVQNWDAATSKPTGNPGGTFIGG